MLFVSSCAAVYIQRTCSIIAHDFFLGKTCFLYRLPSARFFIIESPKSLTLCSDIIDDYPIPFCLLSHFPFLGRIGVLKVINFGIQIVIFSPCNLLTLPSPFL